MAKIKIGQKVKLSFDAMPDITIDGTVAEINPVGVIDQGVVTYDVKISFDKENPEIKPSMSVSATIVTDEKQNVLVIPNSAVKSQGGKTFVEIFDSSLLPSVNGSLGSISKISPRKIPVEIGLSNDTHTEIISGLKEGDEIVIRTILGTSTAA